MNCTHERLDEDGICRKCGLDCRRGTPMTTPNAPQAATDEIVDSVDWDLARADRVRLEAVGTPTLLRSLIARIRSDAATIAELRKDVTASAGELMVPIPEPGTIASKLLIANSMMRQQRNNARDELATLREQLRLAVEGLEQWIIPARDIVEHVHGPTQHPVAAEYLSRITTLNPPIGGKETT